MEFLFELLFEFFGEIMVQVVFEALASAGLHIVRDPDAPPRTTNPWLLIFGYALLGAVAGGLSLLVFSHALVDAPTARLVNLVVAPVAGGLAMAVIGAWRQRRDMAGIALDRFTYGYVFAFAMALVRFHWAT
jgi:uncharacterized membrane-anchored protein